MKKTVTRWACAAALLGTMIGGCGGEEASAETEQPPEPLAVAPHADAPPAEAGPVVDDPSFELRANAHGPYTAGTQGTFEILLTPRGNYHVNQDYPMSVTLTGPDAVAFPSAELGNDDAAERTLQRARFDVPFTASAAGEQRVTVDVDFAVCTPETCMPDRRTLALLLPVE